MRVVPFHERVARPRLSEHAAHHSHGRHKPFEPIDDARNDLVSAHGHEHEHEHAGGGARAGAADDTKSEAGSKVSMLSRRSTRAAAASTSDRVTHEFKFKTTSTPLYVEYYTTGSTTDVQPQDFFEEVEMQRAREAKQRSLSNFEAQWIGRGEFVDGVPLPLPLPYTSRLTNYLVEYMAPPAYDYARVYSHHTTNVGTRDPQGEARSGPPLSRFT